MLLLPFLFTLWLKCVGEKDNESLYNKIDLNVQSNLSTLPAVGNYIFIEVDLTTKEPICTRKGLLILLK